MTVGQPINPAQLNADVAGALAQLLGAFRKIEQ
jgi:hypothetical protein